MNDNVLIATYKEFAVSRKCFLDGILCDPGLRKPLLAQLRGELGDLSEQEMLGRLIYLRKRGRLARQNPR
jgi:hypothetical protein